MAILSAKDNSDFFSLSSGEEEGEPSATFSPCGEPVGETPRRTQWREPVISLRRQAFRLLFCWMMQQKPTSRGIFSSEEDSSKQRWLTE